jgi:lipopolysaccharide export system protein LptA
MKAWQAVALLAGVAVAGPLAALDSDREQPAVIDADEVDIDFETGVRTYRGNVVVRQGTIRLDADEIDVYYKDDVLDTIIAVGRPAIFRQRPEGKEHDVVGRGLKVELDEVNEIVTLTDEASVTQDRDSVTGRIIVYNMATDQVKVRSGSTATRTVVTPEGSTAPPPSPVPEGSSGSDAGGEEASAESDAAETGGSDAGAAQASTASDSETEVQSDGSRPRIVIQPRLEPVQEQQPKEGRTGSGNTESDSGHDDDGTATDAPATAPSG